MFLQMLVSMSKKRNIIILSVVVLAAAVGLISIFFSDIRLFSKAEGSFTFTAAGDYGYNTNTDRVLNKIGEIGPDFHLTTGDMNYMKAGDEEEWCAYVKERVGADLPFELLSGNHESDGQNGLIDNFVKCLPNKIEGVSGEYGKQYFFDYPSEDPFARFILISPTLKFQSGERYDYSPGSKRFGWLQSAVEGAKQKRMSWVIVVSHKDCFSPGRNDCVVGSELMNYLISNVDIILQSHSHIYARSKPLKCVVAGSRGMVWDENCVAKNELESVMKKGNGAIAFSVGTGGQSVREVDTNSEIVNYLAKYMGSNVSPSFGVLKFEVARDQIRGEYVSAVGSFFDSFVINN